MDAVRTCRACGCVEWRACAGGCSWIAADRCSACPDAPLTLPINAAHLRASALKETAHYGWKSGGEQIDRYMHRSADFPTLVVLTTLRGDLVTSRTVYIGAMEVPPEDWTAMADLLNAAADRKAA